MGCSPPSTPLATPTLSGGVESAVVRVMSRALTCGSSHFGHGVVVADDRVLTNAHVVAGSSAVVVADSTGFASPGKVVYFDPHHDLAVIAVPGFEAPALVYGDALTSGDEAFIATYQYGARALPIPVAVTAQGSALSTDIYGRTAVTLTYWTVAGKVEHGVSGAPLVTQSGEVAGLIFAKGDDTEPTGFALSLDHVAPVVAAASQYATAADTGACLDG